MMNKKAKTTFFMGGIIGVVIFLILWFFLPNFYDTTSAKVLPILLFPSTLLIDVLPGGMEILAYMFGIQLLVYFILGGLLFGKKW